MSNLIATEIVSIGLATIMLAASIIIDRKHS